MANSSNNRPAWRRAYDATLGRLWNLVYDKILRPVLLINDSPHAKALGLALGMFVAMTPTVGIQMPIVFLLTSMFSANRLAGIAMVWLSNPVTMVPLYYGFYLLGRVFVNAEDVGYDSVEAVLKPREGESSWDALVHLFEALGWPLWIGSMIVAVVLSVPTYFWARRFFVIRELRRVAKAKKEKEA